LISLDRNTKVYFQILLDLCLIPLVVYASFSLRLGDFYPLHDFVILITIISPILAILVFYSSGLYKFIIRYFDTSSINISLKVVSFYSLLWGVFVFILTIDQVSRSIIIINWILTIIYFIVSRISIRNIFKINSSNKKNILVYGAGKAGVGLINSLFYSDGYRVIALVDDDLQKTNKFIGGYKIYAPDNIANIIDRFDVTEIFFTIQNIDNRKRSDILTSLASHGVKVKILPFSSQINSNDIKYSNFQNINLKDLLSRKPVLADKNLLSKNITNKVVMITGAGGTIGSELGKIINQFQAKAILLIDQNELALYNVNKELSQSKSKIIPILSSVLQTKNLESLMKNYKVETLFHAAAHKHVPMVEQNIVEGVRNNFFGTISCIEAAIRAKVKNFVLISTDKAVRPTNIMGATKRIAEIAIKQYTDNPVTIFSMVRFGNVIGSSGSVIPLFEKQIASGGPVTVTHREITRFFMTTNEAASLVIQASSMARGGEVFLLDMGKPVKIFDLAKKMIKLSGNIEKKESGEGVEIKITGLRPGEKLFEELLIEGNPEKTLHPQIFKSIDNNVPREEYDVFNSRMFEAVDENNPKKIVSLLVGFLKEYCPDHRTVESVK